MEPCFDARLQALMVRRSDLDTHVSAMSQSMMMLRQCLQYSRVSRAKCIVVSLGQFPPSER